MFETFDHTADLGLRVHAATLDALMADAACGLFALIVADPTSIAPRSEQTFRIAGSSPDYLLFDWLNELLYTFEAKRMLFREFTVHTDSQGLTATARGEPLDEQRHPLEHEVKAITYHGLNVQQLTDGTWQAELIVDI